MAVSSILAAPALATGIGLIAALGVTTEARAQQTTSAISGYVLDAEGNAVAGAQVTVTHVPSGTRTTTSTNAAGQFSAAGLRVGGPYTVSASAGGYEGAAVENVYTEIGRRALVALSMVTTAQLAEVEVTAAAAGATAIGVGTEFTAEQIASVASINRDPKQTLRIDPKAWVDATNSDALEVAGVNNRYNSITVDGVRQSDDFGLNNNGYPTQRTPISLDAIEAVSLLTAPFDVQYSSFRGSTINIVTKSGTNEFDGSVYWYTYDDSFVGDKSKDRDFDFAFNEDIYGAALSGPIIQDKLFFALSYEKLEREAPQEYGPAGSGFPIEVADVSQADYDRIAQIASSIYDFEIGDRTTTLPEDDEKIFAKIDWNINDSHRASFSYQKTEGNEIIPSNNSSSRQQLSAPSNWYNRAITLDSYSVQLFSDWTDTFSTEFKYARKEVETLQDSLQGTDFAQMEITTTDGGTVFIGPDEFRHANYLTNDLDQIKLKGDLRLGDHTLSVGYEREMLDIFNLFVSASRGVYEFSSIDDFEARTASRLFYQNAFTNDANDGAAAFGYNVDSLYVQDAWQITPDFELQFGLRYESFSSSDKPLFNQNFFDRYGFSNQETLDGRDLFMPRLGFNWQVSDDTLLRGGVGLFGGGTPNVWVSNSYSNDGVTIVNQTYSDPASPVLQNVDGYNINPEALEDVSNLRGDGSVNAIDPGFEVPSQWKVNLGVEHFFADDWKFSADVILSRVKDEVVWRDIRLVQSGTAPDGRPIYSRQSQGGRSSGAQDLVLDNTDEGESVVFTVDLSKTWDTAAGTFDLYAGYGHQNVKDVNPGTSSTARSNWDNVAVSDLNDPDLATSNYEIAHRFTMALNWRKAFFKDAFTTAGLFLERRSGRPFSYTFASGTSGSVFGDPRQNSRQRQLFYVPSGPDDVILQDVTWDEFSAFLDQTGLSQYAGEIAPRNAFNSPWVTSLDLRLSQEIPLGIADTRAVVTLAIENLANLINNDWGQLRQVSFPYVSPVMDVAIDSESGKYIYKGEPRTPFYSTSALPSVWRMQLGIRVEF